MVLWVKFQIWLARLGSNNVECCGLLEGVALEFHSKASMLDDCHLGHQLLDHTTGEAEP
jgi:hypothetical protein